MANEVRTQILDSIRDRNEKYFGPNGSSKFFRHVVRGPWAPGDPNRDKLTIVDDGQKANSPFMDAADRTHEDGSSDRILSVKFVIDLAGNWHREQHSIDWSNRIEQIVKRFENWRPFAPGAMNMKYIGDDPFTVIFGESVQEEIWLIDFEVTYFVQTDFGD